MFFGVFFEYFIIIELDWFTFLIFLIGLLVLLFLGKLIEIFGYSSKSVEVIRKQDVLNAFINRDNKSIIWLFFPVIIIIEELIFRYYSIGILVQILKMESIAAIFISSLAFSLFHIHIWFRYKNLKILLLNLIYPFFIGFYIGYLFLKLGIIMCVLIHFLIALTLYYNLYKRYFKKNSRIKFKKD
ncbi:MAG: CPBP family intramembrane glutamic endopeptidase [Promethearchaeota archaeon]